MARADIDSATRAYLDRLRQDLIFTETLRGETLRFHTTWGLFSPKGLDEGSRLLIDHLEIRPEDDTLDLGCGYGPLGLIMARLAPAGTSVLVDKDFVAVEYSKRNARLNGIDNVEILLSNGFDAIRERRFDVIVANLPAKVGRAGLDEFLFGAGPLLRSGGTLAFVHVTPLTSQIDGLRADFERSGGKLEVVLESSGKEHRALHWRFPEGLPQRKPASSPRSSAHAFSGIG